MGETTGEIERHIRKTRGELEQNINELHHRVKDAVNWRLHVQRRPWQMLALAFGAGMVTSFVTTTSRSQRTDALNGKSSQMWHNIKVVAAAAAKEFTGEVLQHFREEYRKQESARRRSAPIQEPGGEPFRSQGM